MNNILIYSKILKKHRTYVKEVLNKLREVNLQINIDKCKFKIQKISFLELLIFTNDLRMNSWKVDMIQNWKVLQSLIYMQIFIDFCNFYQWFIKNFSKIIWLMIKLTWKKLSFWINKDLSDNLWRTKATDDDSLYSEAFQLDQRSYSENELLELCERWSIVSIWWWRHSTFNDLL